MLLLGGIYVRQQIFLTPLYIKRIHNIPHLFHVLFTHLIKSISHLISTLHFLTQIRSQNRLILPTLFRQIFQVNLCFCEGTGRFESVVFLSYFILNRLFQGKYRIVFEFYLPRIFTFYHLSRLISLIILDF